MWDKQSSQFKNARTFCESIIDGALPSLQEFIDNLGFMFPLLHEYKNTPQDKEWHAEGDVFIHTQMVLDELYILFNNELKNFSKIKKCVLIFGAVFHDYAKPISTKEQEREGKVRIVSPRHEYKARSLIAFKMYDLFPFVIANTIIHIVGDHHLPKLYAIKDVAYSEYFKLYQYNNMELLYWLEIADMKGRYCTDLDMQLLYLDYFKEQCVKFNMFDVCYNLKTVDTYELCNNKDLDLLSKKQREYVVAKHLYYIRNELSNHITETISKCYEHMNNYAELYILCGISGSGKSYYITENSDLNSVIISLDEIRAEIGKNQQDNSDPGTVRQIAKQRLKTHLAQKKKIFWDATNLTAETRKMLFDIANDYNALVTTVFASQPTTRIFKQNIDRRFPIPETAIHNQLEKFEFPLCFDTHRYIQTMYGVDFIKKGFINLDGDYE